jgi:hypothetical protein
MHCEAEMHTGREWRDYRIRKTEERRELSVNTIITTINSVDEACENINFI